MNVAGLVVVLEALAEQHDFRVVEDDTYGELAPAHLPRLAVRPPDPHWDWPIPVNFQQGVKCGNVIFVGGQVDLDLKGKSLHPGDLERQTRACMDAIRTVLVREESLGGVMAEIDAFVDPRDAEDRWADPSAMIYMKPGALAAGKVAPRPATPM